MFKLLMNGIPPEQRKYWGRNKKECVHNILMYYYNPHLIKKILLLVLIIVPAVVVIKWYNPFTLVVAISIYTLVVELAIRRVFICERF